VSLTENAKSVLGLTNLSVFNADKEFEAKDAGILFTCLYTASFNVMK
jgi:hypothetical protein